MSEICNCDNCNFKVKNDDDYCPNCGSIFTDDKCMNHNNTDAEGICLICSKVCCLDCGLEVNGSFLCNDHSGVEVYQSMGRVHGSSDSLEIDYTISILEEENIHPFKYSRKTSPISLGGLDYSLFRASGEFNGHIINEIKIMVPLSEYLEAKKLIDDIRKE